MKDVRDALFFAIVNIGISEEFFYRLTPAEYSRLLEIWDEKQYREDLRFGVIASTIANCHVDRKKRPNGFSPVDFAVKRGANKQKKSESLSDKILSLVDNFNSRQK